MLKAIQNVIFLGYSGWAAWFCYLTPSWPGFRIPHPLPTPRSAQLVSGCGAEERGLHNTQQDRDRLGNRAPRDPAQLLGKGSHGRSPPCPWRNHKWCWRSYKTKLLMCADVVNTGSTACSIQGNHEFLGPPLPLQCFCDHQQGAAPPLLVLTSEIDTKVTLSFPRGHWEDTPGIGREYQHAEHCHKGKTKTKKSYARFM